MLEVTIGTYDLRKLVASKKVGEDDKTDARCHATKGLVLEHMVVIVAYMDVLGASEHKPAISTSKYLQVTSEQSVVSKSS